MLSSIPCGDLELNLAHPCGTPTLVPSEGLEQQLDLRLDPLWKQPQTTAEAQRLAVHLHVHYLDTLAPLLDALHRCRDGLADYDLWVSTDSSAKASAIRKHVIAIVLATDLAKSFDIVGRFRVTFENPETDPTAEGPKSLLLQMAMKCADVSTAA